MITISSVKSCKKKWSYAVEVDLLFDRYWDWMDFHIITKNMEKWCESNIGNNGKEWVVVNGTTFYFRNENDLLLFQLRWS